MTFQREANIRSFHPTQLLTHGDKYPVNVVRAGDVLSPAKKARELALEEVREKSYKRAPLGRGRELGSCPDERRWQRFGEPTVKGDDVGKLIYSNPKLKVGCGTSGQRQLEMQDFIKSEFALSSGRLGSDGKRLKESMVWPESR